MLLENKSAVIYGAGGAVGSAVAKAFAKQGANVFLSGRSLKKVADVAQEIAASDGVAEAAELDALDEGAVEDHIRGVVAKTGQVDISFNAAGIAGTEVFQRGLQGVPLSNLAVEVFMQPITFYARSQFLTARAAARLMSQRGSGVILMHTPEPARLGMPLIGGMGPAWATMEALSRNLSAEFGARGVRAVCLRSTGIPETTTIDEVFNAQAKALGMTYEQVREFMESTTHTRRSTTLAELTAAAVFAASDMANGITGAVLNLTSGKTVD
jgi:NAD(P)-dependent dehydrogenase (short-subunit alcohol dehydrogenase family)